MVDYRLASRGRRRYPGSPGTIPDPLREEVHVCLDRVPLARGGFALRCAEMEQAQHALTARHAGRLPAPRGAEDAGCPPVGGEAALGRREEDEHDRRSGRADILFVLDQIAGQRGCGEDEGRRAVELRRLRGAGTLLEARECLPAEHTESPRLRQMMIRREARDVEQLDQCLSWNGLGPERLVRPPRRRELGKAHARRAETWSSAPARRSSCENEHPSSAVARAACSAASSIPSAATTASTCEATIWWPSPSTSSITIRHPTSSRCGGVPARVSSLAIDIVRQPPCAAASSSSGLVLPSACPMRGGSEKPSSENAPESALIDPTPRATFPSQTTLALRSIRGISTAPACRRGERHRAPAVRPGRCSRGSARVERADERTCRAEAAPTRRRHAARPRPRA